MSKRVRPDNCVTCGRPMRAPSERAAAHPGTVQYAAKGECNTCYAVGRKKSSRPKPKMKPRSLRNRYEAAVSRTAAVYARDRAVVTRMVTRDLAGEQQTRVLAMLGLDDPEGT